jgi:hypothetical protein
MSQKEYENASESEKKKEDWMNSKWRPMMGWMYMLVCTFDFVIAPVLWSIMQALFKGGVNVQWQPLTLQGAGLFHLAMGAIIGVSSYGRTQEKLNGANNGGIQLPSNAGTTYTPPTAIQPTSPTNFGAAATQPSFSNAPSSFGGGFGGTPSSAPSGFGGGFGGATTIATTASGKKIVPDEPQPLL